MITKQHLFIVGGAALVGFVLANAPSGTGIYATPVGQSLANVYVKGSSFAGAAAATTTTATTVTAPVATVGS